MSEPYLFRIFLFYVKKKKKKVMRCNENAMKFFSIHRNMWHCRQRGRVHKFRARNYNQIYSVSQLTHRNYCCSAAKNLVMRFIQFSRCSKQLSIFIVSKEIFSVISIQAPITLKSMYTQCPESKQMRLRQLVICTKSE